MKWKETAKSIVLFLLIVSMVLIYGFNWVYRLDREEIMRGKTWVAGFARFFGIIQNIDQTALGVEVTPAAYPLKMAARSEAGLSFVQYDRESVMGLYDRIAPLLSAALEAPQEAGLAEEAEYKGALSGRMVYLGFDGDIPFYALSEWLNVTQKKEYDFTARHVVLLDDDGMLSVYVRGGASSPIHRIKTLVSSAPLLEAIGEFAPSPCSFAFESGEEYWSIEPETILPKSPPQINRIEGYPPSFTNGGQAIQTLLEAFSYNPYTVQSYPEGNGTKVYVENLSTLRIEPDGTVHFLVSDAQGGIPVSGILSGENSNLAVVRMIEAARFLVDRATANFRADAVPYLRSCQFDEGTQSYIVSFDMEVSGMPVLLSGGPAAEVEIKDGMICSAVLRLHSYKTTDSENYLLPLRQAVAVYSPSEELNGALWARYEDLGEPEIAASYFIS